jgi:predicted mannosyl-3-phosphoglycerate phosphatase (HAD superfamily)
MYQMADEWKGEGDPPLKYFSLARERIKVRPTPIPVVETLPVTIPEPYEPPPTKPKELEEMEYYELRKIAKKLKLPEKVKKAKMIKLIKEAQAAKSGE